MKNIMRELTLKQINSSYLIKSGFTIIIERLCDKNRNNYFKMINLTLKSQDQRGLKICYNLERLYQKKRIGQKIAAIKKSI